jgi:purine catabolism regulator
VLAEACRAARIPALVGTLDAALIGADGRAGAMVSLAIGTAADEVLGSIAGKVRDRLGPVVIGVGGVADSIRDVRRSFLEAEQVAEVASGGLPYYRLPDLHLRGLLHLLRDDPRLQTFVERELGPLLTHDRRAELLAVLEAYLAAGGNKASAAKDSHLARPTFYDRLSRIERILGVSLDSPETRTSLHVALLASGATTG